MRKCLEKMMWLMLALLIIFNSTGIVTYAASSKVLAKRASAFSKDEAPRLWGKNGFKWSSKYKKEGDGYAIYVNLKNTKLNADSYVKAYYMGMYYSSDVKMESVSKKLRKQIKSKFKLKRISVYLTLWSKDGEMIFRVKNGKTIYDFIYD